MSVEWYYQVDGQIVGPVQPQELKAKALAGTIKKQTLVRKGAAGDWVAASSVQGLLSLPSHAALPKAQPLTNDLLAALAAEAGDTRGEGGYPVAETSDETAPAPLAPHRQLKRTAAKKTAPRATVSTLPPWVWAIFGAGGTLIVVLAFMAFRPRDVAPALPAVEQSSPSGSALFVEKAATQTPSSQASNSIQSAKPSASVPEKPSASLMVEGLLALNSGQYADAAYSFEEAIVRQPESAIAHNYAGVAYLRALDWTAAVRHFNEATKLLPNEPRFYANRALTYIDQEKYALAVSDLKKLIALEPESPKWRRELGLIVTSIDDEATGADLVAADKLEAELLKRPKAPPPETGAAAGESDEFRRIADCIKWRLAHQAVVDRYLDKGVFHWRRFRFAADEMSTELIRLSASDAQYSAILTFVLHTQGSYGFTSRAAVEKPGTVAATDSSTEHWRIEFILVGATWEPKRYAIRKSVSEKWTAPKGIAHEAALQTSVRRACYFENGFIKLAGSNADSK